ncbi:hypothetical protein B0T19DRAFT_437327 [Cercophora scortea]|uniref:Uncharacterized protein n=1 Tax=Cercophora scortea TaxID=314031 RepID=A0AAE0MMJ2_9PEZI|nr:hypothetical protein B0T19DRAFT_437327 [Cercophora scortea]
MPEPTPTPSTQDEETITRDGAPSPTPSTALGVEEERRLSTAVQQIVVQAREQNGAEEDEKAGEAEPKPEPINPSSTNVSASTIASSKLSPRSPFKPPAASDAQGARQPAEPNEYTWDTSRQLSPTQTDGQRRKTVRHSDVVYIIPVIPAEGDRVSSDDGRNNLDVEKVLTKPRKGHAWEASEVTCAACFVGVWVLSFMAFCGFYLLGAFVGWFGNVRGTGFVGSGSSST